MLPVAVGTVQAEADQYILPGLVEFRSRALAAPAPGAHPEAANEDAAPVLRQYQVRCRQDLHQAVTEAARRAGTSPAQLVRCALAILPATALEGLSDPGAPRPRDAIRVGRRLETPLLRLRLPAGLTAVTIRRVLGFVVNMAAGRTVPRDAVSAQAQERDLAAERAQGERLSEALAVLAGEPLKGGVRSRADALHVMRFPPDAKPMRDTVIARFRALAGVLHPDAGLVDHHGVMAQLLDARRILMQAG